MPSCPLCRPAWVLRRLKVDRWEGPHHQLGFVTAHLQTQATSRSPLCPTHREHDTLRQPLATLTAERCLQHGGAR